MELSAPARQELAQVVRDAPPNLARRARIILERADGGSLATIARNVGLHRDSVRRWLKRYQERGLAGLQHGNAGKARYVTFDRAVRDEIRRRASLSPAALGEDFGVWSLSRLRDHLMRRGVVPKISVERLRQLLAAQPISHRFWCRGAPLLPPLAPETRDRLVELARQPESNQARRARVVLAIADGATVASVASTLHLGRNSIRRWLDHFRTGGIAGLRSRYEPGRHAWPAPIIGSANASSVALDVSDRGKCDR